MSDKPPKRRVLIIANAFPPTGGAGVQRTAKFAKYLTRFGWRPVVWSASYVPSLPLDATLLDDLPDDLDCRRRPTWDPTRRIERTLTPLAELVGGWSAMASLVDGIARRLGRLSRWLLARCVPDEQVIWALSSYRTLRRIIRDENIGVIFSTFSPASNHLLAWMLQKKTGLPWVADFRGLWTDDHEHVGRWVWRRLVDRALEQRFLTGAEAVIAASNAQRDILADRVPHEKGKFHTIPNGLDFEDFDKIPSCHICGTVGPERKKFTLTFAGQFRETQVSPEYLEGIGKFIRRSAEYERGFELRIVGQISDRLRERAHEAGVPLVATGYLPHLEALSEMNSADMLLLPTAIKTSSSSVVPGKVFEYLGSGRPIFVIGERDSTVARLVESLEAGVCVDRNAEAIADALTAYWWAWKEGGLPGGCKRNKLVRLDLEALADRLSGVMIRLIGHTVIAERSLPVREVAAAVPLQTTGTREAEPVEVMSP